MTLFHPATGQVRVKGVSSCTNAILHPWLKQELTSILEQLPLQAGDWNVWYPEFSEAFLKNLPPLRLLLILDNLAGHKTHSFVRWCFTQGIALLYTPVGGSWLNMAESIQHILKSRALDGAHPQTPQQIFQWFEEVATCWNQQPTPFIWKGKRWHRRKARQKQWYVLKGSGACIRQQPEMLKKKKRRVA